MTHFEVKYKALKGKYIVFHQYISLKTFDQVEFAFERNVNFLTFYIYIW